MYEQLFERNKKALAFLKEKIGLTDNELFSISPIRHTKLNTRTIVGIAALLTEFSEKTIESNYIELDATIDEAYHYDEDNKRWLINGSTEVLIKKEDLDRIKHKHH